MIQKTTRTNSTLVPYPLINLIHDIVYPISTSDEFNAILTEIINEEHLDLESLTGEDLDIIRYIYDHKSNDIDLLFLGVWPKYNKGVYNAID